jgi:predicted lipoprotein with Yx(FWY)xxD motif
MHLIPLRARAILPLVAASALILAACTTPDAQSTEPSSGGGVDVTLSQTDAGDALAGAGGMTLYILTTDVDGNSTCTSGACASAWPALMGDGSQVQPGPGVSGTFGTATWADGTRQVTHNGQPLYYYAGDSAPGDANGQGSGGVWFIAPVGAASASRAQGTPDQSATPSYAAPDY